MVILLTLFLRVVRGSSAGATMAMRRVRACSTSTASLAIVAVAVRSASSWPQLRETSVSEVELALYPVNYGASSMRYKLRTCMCHSHSFLRVTRGFKKTRV